MKKYMFYLEKHFYSAAQLTLATENVISIVAEPKIFARDLQK